MPVYNAEIFVSDAVESILSQSYHYFEFLIIDDGSTDNSLSIIRSYKDPRIRLISHESNKGLQYTLNEGVRLASYDLIARMDADDISHPWRIEKQVVYMLAHPHCAMVDSWVKVMDKAKNFIRAEGIYSRFVYYTLTFECCIYHSSVMYRREAVLAVGGYQLPYAEDYDLFWRLTRIFKIYTIEEPLLWYRLHEQNLNTVLKKAEYNEYTLKVWNRNLEYYIGNRDQTPLEWIACYCYDFDPLLKKKDLDEILKCIDLLQKLSEHILSTENPNRNSEDIKFISQFKKKYILKELGKRLPLFQMMRLMLYFRQSSLVAPVLINRLKELKY